MLRKIIVITVLLNVCIITNAQTFGGNIKDAEGISLENAVAYIVEDDLTALTDNNGSWSIIASDTNPKTIVFGKEGFTYEQIIGQLPAIDISIVLRNEQKSSATLREEGYLADGCSSVDIPDDPKWNITFEIQELKGDLAPDPTYTRRDPSSVIEVNDTFFVWYSYSLTNDNAKIAPWDLNDLYYASSVDGITWTEHGIAVGRGEAGSFDHRSVFTTEIFVYENTYYLVYQAAADKDGIYNRNVVGMAKANSPRGPWIKLNEPVLRPTYTNDTYFDNNAVHDPCIIQYNNKFHLYYKGECNCMGAIGCANWCNPVCGLGKQVKWGVAVADDPAGPYKKSVFNPVTNTGHEVMVWPYADGLAILQHQDGPEANSIQYSGDGFNFDIKGKVTNFPEAAGLYRSSESDSDPHAGVSWGLGHKLMWNSGPHGWMYIYRFYKVNTSVEKLNIIADTLQLGLNENRKLNVKLVPYLASASDLTWISSDQSIATVDNNGIVGALTAGWTTIYATSGSEKSTDSCQIYVTEDSFIAHMTSIPANSFTGTGGIFDDAPSGGPGFGVNATSGGINFVNSNDWCTYQVTIPEKGKYELKYSISTPMENPEVSLEKKHKVLAKDEVYINGVWDSYYTLYSDSTLTFREKGDKELKLVASGINDWQWNMQSFSFVRLHDIISISDVGSTNAVHTPLSQVDIWINKNELHIEGAKGIYHLSIYGLNGVLVYASIHTDEVVISLDGLNKGLYLVRFLQNSNSFTTKILL